MIAQHVANLVAKARAQGGRRIDQTVLLRVLANRLRGRERLGLFVSEALLRLALLGTAVGFILMLIPIAGLTSFDVGHSAQGAVGHEQRDGGRPEYNCHRHRDSAAAQAPVLFLATGVVDLYDMITEVTEVHVISALEHDRDG